MKKSARLALMIVWIAIIFFLTGYPSLEVPKIKEFPLDKIYHILLFFILGMLELPILKPMGFFLLGCGIVLVAEFQQVFIPGRDFEILDMVAGFAGLVVIYIIFKIRRRYRNDLSKT